MKSLRKTIERLFYLFVFLLPWQTKLILRPAATNFNEISLYASHLLLLAILILFFYYKFKQRRGSEKVSWLWGLLMILEVFILFSFFVAPDQVLAFYHYVLFIFGIGVFYLLWDTMQIDGYKEEPLDKFKVIYSFLAGMFLQAILGIYQFLNQTSLVSKYLGLANHDPNLAGTAVVETASGRWLRAYGGFDHPNIFGGVLAIALIFTAYLLAKKKIIRSGKEVAESIFLFIFYFTALIALFFAFSRAGWLAFGAGLAVLLITLIAQKDRWIIGRFLALVFFSATMVFLIACPYQELLQTRVEMETRLEQKSVTERELYFTQAAGLIKSHPLLGVGSGNYPLVLEKEDNSAHNVWDYQPVHNVFALLWAESGLFALLSFLGFLGLLIIKNRRSVFSGAVFVALIILMLLDHWLLSLPFGLVFLFFILGLI